jgi:hypothetical protein
MKYIIIAFLFITCTNISSFHKVPPLSHEPLDTIQSSPASIVATPFLFESAFIKGTTQKQDNSNVPLYGITIGKIKIESGHIIACDPMHIDEYGNPFRQVFPTGEYPVQLSIAKRNDKETVAFARINFSDEPVVKWEFALLEGQSKIPLGDEKKHGYSVDAGVGIFIDEQANKALDFKTMVYNMDGAVYKEMDKHYRNHWRYTIYKFGNHNLAAFSTGEGDGYYATYIGIDAKGETCRLLTDFGLFDWR